MPIEKRRSGAPILTTGPSENIPLWMTRSLVRFTAENVKEKELLIL